MAITNMPQMQIIYDKLKYLSASEQAYNDNLARANLPGAKESIVAPYTFTLKQSAGSLQQTNSAHMAGAQNAGVAKVSKQKVRGGSLSGNTISPEQQLMKLNEAATQTVSMEKAHLVNVKLLKDVYGIGR